MLNLFVDRPRYVVYDTRLWYFVNYLDICIYFFQLLSNVFVIDQIKVFIPLIVHAQIVCR